MAHNNTVLSQILKLVCRHEFESLAKQHHEGQNLRKMTRWGQFVTLTMAQLSGRTSLRDIESNMAAQQSRLYHLGIGKVSRSTLARVNQSQPSSLYEALFNRLLHRCQSTAPRHGFRFKNRLLSLDASTIDLCLSVFPWAKFRATKGAVKLHAVVDRGYTDYSWYSALNNKGIWFVTRQKRNATYRTTDRRAVKRSTGLTSDTTIRIVGSKAAQCAIALRRIGYRDPETGKHYVFLTNNFKLAAKTIAEIYKARWQIEMFFKWIKQNLKIKTFLGTSKNAVMTQIWIALCTYLILSYLKFSTCMARSLGQILKLLQLNLFERRELVPLIKGQIVEPPGVAHQNQMSLL